MQHPRFGAEFRELLASDKVADRELAGILVDELGALREAKENRRLHPNEDRLNGDDLDGIGYLRLYIGGYSVRIYFAVIRGNLWMLALDPNKRKTNLTDGMKTRLASRLREAQELASKHDGSDQRERGGREEVQNRGK
ncbi:hypothetical protein [Sorangium cellulosum]|uniref:hypothetical protein n=1 Tax=Sorangium cellulosum TaxID=56 RepID=UPI0012DAFAA7|nr:hypothetical protein [Sorangium cellulosum]